MAERTYAQEQYENYLTQVERAQKLKLRVDKQNQELERKQAETESYIAQVNQSQRLRASSNPRVTSLVNQSITQKQNEYLAEVNQSASLSDQYDSQSYQTQRAYEDYSSTFENEQKQNQQLALYHAGQTFGFVNQNQAQPQGFIHYPVPQGYQEIPASFPGVPASFPSTPASYNIIPASFQSQQGSIVQIQQPKPMEPQKLYSFETTPKTANTKTISVEQQVFDYREKSKKFFSNQLKLEQSVSKTNFKIFQADSFFDTNFSDKNNSVYDENNFELINEQYDLFQDLNKTPKSIVSASNAEISLSEDSFPYLKTISKNIESGGKTAKELTPSYFQNGEKMPIPILDNVFSGGGAIAGGAFGAFESVTKGIEQSYAGVQVFFRKYEGQPAAAFLSATSLGVYPDAFSTKEQIQNRKNVNVFYEPPSGGVDIEFNNGKFGPARKGTIAEQSKQLAGLTSVLIPFEKAIPKKPGFSNTFTIAIKEDEFLTAGKLTTPTMFGLRSKTQNILIRTKIVDEVPVIQETINLGKTGGGGKALDEISGLPKVLGKEDFIISGKKTSINEKELNQINRYLVESQTQVAKTKNTKLNQLSTFSQAPKEINQNVLQIYDEVGKAKIKNELFDLEINLKKDQSFGGTAKEFKGTEDIFSARTTPNTYAEELASKRFQRNSNSINRRVQADINVDEFFNVREQPVKPFSSFPINTNTGTLADIGKTTYSSRSRNLFDDSGTFLIEKQSGTVKTFKPTLKPENIGRVRGKFGASMAPFAQPDPLLIRGYKTKALPGFDYPNLEEFAKVRPKGKPLFREPKLDEALPKTKPVVSKLVEPPKITASLSESEFQRLNILTQTKQGTRGLSFTKTKSKDFLSSDVAVFEYSNINPKQGVARKQAQEQIKKLGVPSLPSSGGAFLLKSPVYLLNSPNPSGGVALGGFSLGSDSTKFDFGNFLRPEKNIKPKTDFAKDFKQIGTGSTVQLQKTVPKQETKQSQSFLSEKSQTQGQTQNQNQKSETKVNQKQENKFINNTLKSQVQPSKLLSQIRPLKLGSLSQIFQNQNNKKTSKAGFASLSESNKKASALGFASLSASRSETAFRAASRLKMAEATSTREKQKEKTATKPKQVPRVPNFPPRAPPVKIPSLEKEDKEKKKTGFQGGFDVLVKKNVSGKRQFLVVTPNNRSLPRQQAINYGENITDNAVERSFIIRKSSKPVGKLNRELPNLDYKFRRTQSKYPLKRRSEAIIEKTTYAIDSQGEVKGLKAAKVAAKYKKFVVKAFTGKRK